MKKIVIVSMILILIGSFVASQQLRFYTTTAAILSAPGHSDAVGIQNQMYTMCTWYYTIATINTNVIMALKAKTGSSAWTTIDGTVTHTVNGYYGFTWTNCASADSIRLDFVSETGGTAAVITHQAKFFGGF